MQTIYSYYTLEIQGNWGNDRDALGALQLMVGLVLLHAGAALYHHLILKDKTLKRMWFKKT